MTINDRFKELRKTFGLSQEELGSKIGLSKSGISNIESGTRNVTDKHIKLICSELPVNEEWLRDGVGDLIRNTPTSVMEQLRKEFDLDDFSYNLVYEYLKLGQDRRKSVRDFFYQVFNGSDGVASDPFSDAPDTPEDLEDKYPPIADESKDAG